MSKCKSLVQPHTKIFYRITPGDIATVKSKVSLRNIFDGSSACKIDSCSYIFVYFDFPFMKIVFSFSTTQYSRVENDILFICKLAHYAKCYQKLFQYLIILLLLTSCQRHVSILLGNTND